MLAEALEALDKYGERFYEAELYRLGSYCCVLWTMRLKRKPVFTRPSQ